MTYNPLLATLTEIETIARKAVNGELPTKGPFYSDGMQTIGRYVLDALAKAEETQKIH